MDKKRQYPDEVERYLDQLEQALQQQSFYTEGPGIDTDRATVRRVFAKVVLKRWLDDGDLYVTDVEFSELMSQCVFESALQLLISKGFVDVIENEDGEEVVFLTKQGRQYTENLISEHPGLEVHPVVKKPF